AGVEVGTGGKGAADETGPDSTLQPRFDKVRGGQQEAHRLTVTQRVASEVPGGIDGAMDVPIQRSAVDLEPDVLGDAAVERAHVFGVAKALQEPNDGLPCKLSPAVVNEEVGEVGILREEAPVSEDDIWRSLVGREEVFEVEPVLPHVHRRGRTTDVILG